MFFAPNGSSSYRDYNTNTGSHRLFEMLRFLSDDAIRDFGRPRVDDMWRPWRTMSMWPFITSCAQVTRDRKLVRKLDDGDWLLPNVSWQNDVDFTGRLKCQVRRQRGRALPQAKVTYFCYTPVTHKSHWAPIKSGMVLLPRARPQSSVPIPRHPDEVGAET